MWFGEIPSCCSSTVLLGPAWVLLNYNLQTIFSGPVQEWVKFPFPGLVNFVPAVAYHFCLNLPKTFSQPGNGILAQP